MRGQDEWITVRYIAPTAMALPAALINTLANALPAERLRGRSPGRSWSGSTFSILMPPE